MERIRISKGVGDSPVLWAVIARDEPDAHSKTQIGEFDISDQPGRYDGTGGIIGMSGIIYCSTGPALHWPTGWHNRSLYSSVDSWVEDIANEYADATIIRADDESQEWL